MTQRHELRWGGYAGAGFLVLSILASLLPGRPPRVTETAGSIMAWVSDGRDRMLWAALFEAAAAGLVIWFSAAFAEAIREREERTDVHLALLAGSVLIGGALFVYAAMLGMLAYGVDSRSASATASMFTGMMVLNLLLGFAAALPLTAAGLGVLRTHLMPDWLGYAGLGAAGISVLAGLGIFVDSGIYAPGGGLMPYVALTVGGIFVACTSYFMVREHLPEVRPMTLPQT